jgi:hypothetical protein
MINHKIHKLKIDIGTHPTAHHDGPFDVSSYDAVLDVSDYPTYNINGTLDNRHHYPIVEWDKWGYGPFYWAVKLLDHYTSKGSSVYLHCYAGKHRSVQIAHLYLLSLGYTLEEAFAMFDTQWKIRLDNKTESSNQWLKHFYDKDIQCGRIPADAVEFMKQVRLNPDKSALQVLSLMKEQSEHDAVDKDLHITYLEKE